jgi:hypothetical protein
LPVEVRRLQSSDQVVGGSQPDSDDDENGSGYGDQNQPTMLLHAAKLLIASNGDEHAREVPLEDDPAGDRLHLRSGSEWGILG